MRVLKLTAYPGEYDREAGEYKYVPVLVIADKIAAVTQSKYIGELHTAINGEGGHIAFVNETPEEVIAMMQRDE